MRNVIIKLLGGVKRADFDAMHAASDNAHMLRGQVSDRLRKLEHEYEKMEDNFLRACTQVEQLQELLNQTERRLENTEEERANASKGWNDEISDHAKTIVKRDEANAARAVAHGIYEKERDIRKKVEVKLIEAERRIAELNTLIAKESDRPKIEFLITGGETTSHPGSRTPLVLSLEVNGYATVDLRSLSYSKANKATLIDIRDAANEIVSQD